MLKIRLDDIPPEGKEFVFDQRDRELAAEFADLGLSLYQVAVKIYPLDAYYQLTGELKAQVPEVCGRCGFEIELDLHTTVNEMILPKPLNPRGSSYTKSGSVEDSASSSPKEVAYHQDGLFLLGEYLHEVVALEIPHYPTCRTEGCSREDEMKDRLQKINQESEKFAEKKEENAFQRALKDFRAH